MKPNSHSNRLKLLSLTLIIPRIFIMSTSHTPSALCISTCDHEISRACLLHHKRALCGSHAQVTFIYDMIPG